jgi:aspartyl-tRNA(Asn)/glutamyl-tRNA(Gln) amidotransferase subunit A
MTDLAFLGLAEASDLIAARKLSPVEYTQALLDRAAKLDSRCHAFIRLTPDIAMHAARSPPGIAAGRCTACPSPSRTSSTSRACLPRPIPRY